MKIETRELTPSLWPDVEKLFGPNGACGGCWCMYWRTEKGQSWEATKGSVNRSRSQKLVRAGKAHGILAYENGEPIGWCSFDRRTDYAKLDRAPSFQCDDGEKVWSIPCFFIKRGFRRKGVAKRLLADALTALKRRKAEIVEGYPVRPGKAGKEIPAAFAWTGTRSLFVDAGFSIVGNRDGGKQRVRKLLDMKKSFPLTG